MKEQKKNKLYAWLPTKKDTIFTEDLVEISKEDLELILGTFMTSDRLKNCLYENPNILVTLNGVIFHIKESFQSSKNMGGILNLEELQKIKENSNPKLTEVVTDFITVFYDAIMIIKQKEYTVSQLKESIDLPYFLRNQKKQYLKNLRNQLRIGEINQKLLAGSNSYKQKERTKK